MSRRLDNEFNGPVSTYTRLAELTMYKASDAAYAFLGDHYPNSAADTVVKHCK